jgi:hypothetical protein
MTAQLNSMEDVSALLTSEKRQLVETAVVLGRLGLLLGPKGIQHHLLCSVLQQIEGSCNRYLQVLAEGGIQLSLRSDADTEKIVKSVYARVGLGPFRERSLSQLSGGQWRRVSLALDLAFADFVRDRGLLRSNVLVMDEILTHLDATGRQAVGSVLRRMVGGAGGGIPDKNEDEALETAGPSESENGDDGGLLATPLAGGNYETVLVILQDLAAMEMEESFDHVDIVVRDSKGSKVQIDGVSVK